jgi:hypothetical protein
MDQSSNEKVDYNEYNELLIPIKSQIENLDIFDFEKSKDTQN